MHLDEGMLPFAYRVRLSVLIGELKLPDSHSTEELMMDHDHANMPGMSAEDHANMPEMDNTDKKSQPATPATPPAASNAAKTDTSKLTDKSTALPPARKT